MERENAVDDYELLVNVDGLSAHEAAETIWPSACPTCGSDDHDLALGPECLFDGDYDRWHDNP